jgi:hypothetical protein
MKQGPWAEAGRCLLHTREIPDRTIIERVTGELRAQITPGSEFKMALEILASLAQRAVVGFILLAVKLPKNDLLTVVNEVIPPSTQIEVAEENETADA